MEDKIAAYVLTGLIIFVGLLIIFAIWCMCRAASDADDIVEQWNRN